MLLRSLENSRRDQETDSAGSKLSLADLFSLDLVVVLCCKFGIVGLLLLL